MNLQDVRASFGRQAGYYANPQSASLFGDPAGLARMAGLCSAGDGVRALDVATGTGFTAFGLARAGCRVTALDDTETLRDPSHVSCWRGGTWERFCAAAGLRVVHSERPKWRYVMDHWFGRTDMTPEKRSRLIERIRAVPEGWREPLSMDLAQDPPVFGTPLVEIVAIRD